MSVPAQLLAFDPGKHHFGWAAFLDGVLVRCGLSSSDHKGLESFAALGYPAVIEVPQVYQKQRGKDPNDLIDVAIVVGRILQALGPGDAVEVVRPRTWKGTAPKVVMGARIEERLSAEELGTLFDVVVADGLRHNVVDAIGIGLWRLGRLTARKVR